MLLIAYLFLVFLIQNVRLLIGRVARTNSRHKLFVEICDLLASGQRARLLLRQPAQVFNFYCLKIDWKGQKYKNRGRKMSIENKNVLQNWFQAAEERDECI